MTARDEPQQKTKTSTRISAASSTSSKPALRTATVAAGSDSASSGAPNEADTTSLHELVLDRLRRQTDVALALAGQMQSRAQIVSATLSLIAAGIGIVIAANPELLEVLRQQRVVPHAVAALIALGAALACSVVAAYPTGVAFTKAKWFDRRLQADGIASRVPLTRAADAFTDLRKVLDSDEVQLYEDVLSANKWRGYALAFSLVAMALAVGLIAAIVVIAID